MCVQCIKHVNPQIFHLLAFRYILEGWTIKAIMCNIRFCIGGEIFMLISEQTGIKCTNKRKSIHNVISGFYFSKIHFVTVNMAQVVFRVFALQNGLWPAKDLKTFNCGLIPTTEGPDTRYSLPKSPTKRVPIT